MDFSSLSQRRRSKRICPVCRSTKFRKDATGQLCCILGHVQQNFAEEGQDDREGGAHGARRHHVRSQKSALSQKKLLEREIASRSYFGLRAPLSVVVAALQCALAKLTYHFAKKLLKLPSIEEISQLENLLSNSQNTITFELFEATVAQLWATYVTLMGFNDIPSLFPDKKNTKQKTNVEINKDTDSESEDVNITQNETASETNINHDTENDDGFKSLMDFAALFDSTGEESNSTDFNPIKSKPNLNYNSSLRNEKNISNSDSSDVDMPLVRNGVNDDVLGSSALSKKLTNISPSVRKKPKGKKSNKSHIRALDNDNELFLSGIDGSNGDLIESKSEPNKWKKTHSSSLFSHNPLPYHSIVFLYLACRLLNIPILLEDIRDSAMKGKLPYFATLKAIPRELRNRFSVFHSGIENKNIPTIEKLEYESASLILLLETCTNIDFCPINYIPIWSRLIKQFSLYNCNLLESAQYLNWFLYEKPYNSIIPYSANKNYHNEVHTGLVEELNVASIFCVTLKLLFPINGIDMISSYIKDNNLTNDNVNLTEIINILVKASKTITDFKEEVLDDKLDVFRRYGEWSSNSIDSRLEYLSSQNSVENSNIESMDEIVCKLEEIRKYLINFSWPTLYNYNAPELMGEDYKDENSNEFYDSSKKNPFKFIKGEYIINGQAAKFSQNYLNILQPSKVKTLLNVVNSLFSSRYPNKGKNDGNEKMNSSFNELAYNMFQNSKLTRTHYEYWTELKSYDLEQSINTQLGTTIVNESNIYSTISLLSTKIILRFHSTILQNVALIFGRPIDELENRIVFWEKRLLNDEKILQHLYLMTDVYNF